MSWYDILRDLLRHSNKFTSFELNFVRQNIEHVLEYYVEIKWNQLDKDQNANEKMIFRKNEFGNEKIRIL